MMGSLHPPPRPTRSTKPRTATSVREIVMADHDERRTTSRIMMGAAMKRRHKYLSSSYCATLLVAFLCATSFTTGCLAFMPSMTNSKTIPSIKTTTLLHATQPPKSTQGNKQKSKPKQKTQPKYKTIADMMKAMEKNPSQFVTPGTSGREVNANGRRVDGKKKPKRSRKRVERPKQKYVYASQRRALEMMEAQQKGGGATTTNRPNNNEFEGELMHEEGDEEDEKNARMNNPNQQQLLLQQQQTQKQVEFLRSLNLNPTTQVADAIVGNSPEDVPMIVASVRVDGDESVESVTSNSFAYVVYKPVGWSILGEKKKKGDKTKVQQGLEDDGTATQSSGVSLESTETVDEGDAPTSKTSSSKKIKRVKAYDAQTDDFTFVEYNEADILAVLTPEERAELMKEGGLNLDDDSAEMARGAMAGTEWDDGGDDENMGLYDDNAGLGKKKKKNKPAAASSVVKTMPRMQASINTTTRPSLVSWLKQLKATEGTPIKGGKNWVALSGATEIDDSGLVLLCPRDRTEAVHVDRCGYLAIVGNGKKMVSRSKLLKSANTIVKSSGSRGEVCDDSTAEIEILSRLKRGRDSDPVVTVGVSFPDGISTCSHAALLCQDRFRDGVRGDAFADPLDRRASRRLVHCESMTVTSLVNLDDEPADEVCTMPDDVANYVGRRDDAVFARGSFLGRRAGLAQNGLTNAYREVNGAADGFPGWIVDRYDKWLFVQQEEGPGSIPRGPLPSLHDGYTAGVYHLPTKADRSIMGTEKLKPALLEGKAAPELFPVLENGVTYLVNLGDSFSTGIFLDQRLQRAWLSEVCNEETRVLNCFAHTGAFSVAAATAGAKTVSLDLDKKWLDRIRPQMEANGITEWDGVHDCIYGDCFDWLARLAKRGEQFDIVILDPPSTSVGKKKKRWSVKNDTDELVALAAPLVKRDGLLISTTNSASLRADKFARMCMKGLKDAGIENPKLERVSPMPSDFVSVGSQPVKNLVWRIP